MSDEWAKQYLDIHTQRQQEKRDAQRRRQLAEAGAPDMFQRLKDRVQQDLRTLFDAGVLRSLTFRETSASEFSVRDMDVRWTEFPPSLVVELDMILVKYQYRFPVEEGSRKIQEKVGTLRICSDLDGVTHLYKNGDTFADESEASEFLLKPLLDFVDA